LSVVSPPAGQQQAAERPDVLVDPRAVHLGLAQGGQQAVAGPAAALLDHRDHVGRELLAGAQARGGHLRVLAVFAHRSVVHEPMSHGRLFLLGDAAHLVAPMGGKGMNLALHDAEVFVRAVRAAVLDG
jgi:2-polyprenyl-6-methoxyphenol hydroxylase-like FAD-dependent oxidoreductase